jgi:hypothetical protein
MTWLGQRASDHRTVATVVVDMDITERLQLLVSQRQTCYFWYAFL